MDGMPFQDEDPAPAVQAIPVDCFENPAGERGAHDNGQRLRHHEPGLRASAIFGAKPVGEIHDNAREEACLRGAQQKSGRIELRLCFDEAAERGHQAPGDHDAGQPFARAPAFHDKTAGDFEEEVSNEKDARAQADCGIGEPEFALHLELCDAEVCAIDIRKQIRNDEQGHQPPHHPAASPRCD